MCGVGGGEGWEIARSASSQTQDQTAFKIRTCAIPIEGPGCTVLCPHLSDQVAYCSAALQGSVRCSGLVPPPSPEDDYLLGEPEGCEYLTLLECHCHQRDVQEKALNDPYPAT